MMPTSFLDDPRSAKVIMTDPKQSRAIRTKIRMQHAMRELANAHSKYASLGPDPLVDQLVAAKGLSNHVATLRMVAGRNVFTAICVPTNLWRDEFTKAQLLEIKAEAAFDRTRCILVPQGWLRGNCRSNVARALSGSRNVKFTDAHVARVLDLIGKERITTLSACAGAIKGHDDPIGAVLSMCCAGLIEIDRSHPITSGSWISTLLSLPN